VIRRLLNRLIGRTDSSVDEAINAYVDGTASSDETRTVERMAQENPALEKDLSTQMTLREVLGRIDKIEAPRSFAVSPEMVAAAERSESSLSRFAQIFAPQRKLALAPAVIAGIAALSVALLTLGDVTGVVDQSGSNESSSAATVAESGISTGTGGGGASIAEDSDASLPQIEMASEAQEAPLAAAGRAAPNPAATPAPAATAAPAALAPQTSADQDDAVAAAAPPAPAEARTESFDAESDGPAGDSSILVAPEEDEPTELTTAKSSGTGDTGDTGASDEPAELTEDAEPITADGSTTSDSADSVAAAEELATSKELATEPTASTNGISLPLWQLQIALAALAVAAIGAWAGLRRARGE
jgi:hypothetical protein